MATSQTSGAGDTRCPWQSSLPEAGFGRCGASCWERLLSPGHANRHLDPRPGHECPVSRAWAALKLETPRWVASPASTISSIASLPCSAASSKPSNFNKPEVI